MENNLATVYYLDDNQNIRRLKQIDKQLKDTKEDLGIIKHTAAVLELIETILTEMKNIAEKSLECTDRERAQLNSDFEMLKAELEKALKQAEINNINLLDGTFGDMKAVISALTNAF